MELELQVKGIEFDCPIRFSPIVHILRRKLESKELGLVVMPLLLLVLSMALRRDKPFHLG